MGKERKGKKKRSVSRQERNRLYRNRPGSKPLKFFDRESTSEEDGPTEAEMANRLFRSKSAVPSQSRRKKARKSPTCRERRSRRSRSPTVADAARRDAATQTDSEMDTFQPSGAGRTYSRLGLANSPDESEEDAFAGYMAKERPLVMILTRVIWAGGLRRMRNPAAR